MSVPGRGSFEQRFLGDTWDDPEGYSLGRQLSVMTQSRPSSVDCSEASIEASEIHVKPSVTQIRYSEISVEPSGTSIRPSEKSSDPFITRVTDAPPGWPEFPRPVEVPTSSIVLDLTTDLILLALSIAFYVFAIAVRFYDEAAISDYPAATELLFRLSKYGPTVFPILFASVLGRASTTIMIWRLERGERIGDLDLLAASTSLTNTVISQARTGTLRPLGFVLTVLWILSPIGGQASLRHVMPESSVTNGSMKFMYLLPTGYLTTIANDSASWVTIDQYFAASLYNPRSESAATDIWGNVKIPSLEFYENKLAPSSEGWYAVDANHTKFSSLVGVPITNINASIIDKKTDYMMNIETSYLSLNCSVLQWVLISNMTAQPEKLLSRGQYNIWSHDNSNTRYLINPKDLQPRRIAYWDDDRVFKEGTERSVPECLMTTTYVEAEIVCNSSSICATTRIRRSTSDSPLNRLPPGFTLLDNWGYNSSGWNWTMSHLLNNIPGQALAEAMKSTPYKENYEKIDPDGLALQLGQLINTYWQCINMRGYLWKGIPQDLRPLVQASTQDLKVRTPAYSTVDVRTATHIEILKSHYGWTTALSVASWTMIIAGLATPLIRHLCIKGPDMMLNFSGMATKNTDHTNLPQTGTYLSLSDRAKLLREIRVRFGDVQPDMDVGKLAFGAVNDSVERTIDYVRRGRLYE